MPVKNKSKSREVTVGTSGAAIPSYIREVFGDPPVLSTENRDAYDSLLARLAIEIEPREIMEWLWVRDLADLTWQILRLRRVITSVLNISFKPALIQILDTILPRMELQPLWRSQAQELAEAWYSDSKERNRVSSILAKYGLKPESLLETRHRAPPQSSEGGALARHSGTASQVGEADHSKSPS